MHSKQDKRIFVQIRVSIVGEQTKQKAKQNKQRAKTILLSFEDDVLEIVESVTHHKYKRIVQPRHTYRRFIYCSNNLHRQKKQGSQISYQSSNNLTLSQI